MKIYSISQITRYIKAVLEEDVILGDIWLEGEISNAKAHSSGHLYFTLKDAAAAISCVMFRSQAAECSFTPTDGQKVVAWGRVSVYEKTGGYQLYVQALKPSGLGELHLAYEQLKAKLDERGWFNIARKRDLPPYPHTIGLVTSGDGAAVADMISVIRRRNKAVKILLVPVKVQGEGAAASIADGIRQMNRYAKADVIITGRGGGSFEDLWPFNEEAVARAVVESRLPVVSAVGHETDFTICDFVADRRAPTPSAAAELVTPVLGDILENIEQRFFVMNAVFAQKLDALTGRLAWLANEKVLRCPIEKLYGYEIQTETLLKRLDTEATRRTVALRYRLERDAALLESLSPLNALTRGYAVVRKGGALVNTAALLSPGDDISLRLAGGEASCRVLAVDSNKSLPNTETNMSECTFLSSDRLLKRLEHIYKLTPAKESEPNRIHGQNELRIRSQGYYMPPPPLYSAKRCRSELFLGYNGKYDYELAPILIEYIREHLESATEIELWKIWLGDEHRQHETAFEYSNSNLLTPSVIRQFMQHDTLNGPLCLTIYATKEE